MAGAWASFRVFAGAPPVSAVDSDGSNSDGIDGDIVVVPETAEMRLAARKLSRAGDICLEVGCSYGDCTRSLLKGLSGRGHVVAADCSIECLRSARESLRTAANVVRAPFLGDRGEDADMPSSSASSDAPLGDAEAPPLPLSLDLVLLDALKYPRQLSSLTAATGPSLVLLDIGGNRDLESVAATLLALEASCTTPRTVVVKSRALFKALQLTIDDLHSGEDERGNEQDERTGAGEGEGEEVPPRCLPFSALVSGNHWPAQLVSGGNHASTSAEQRSEEGSPVDIFAELNPLCPPGQTQLCHTFLNKGACRRKKGCFFRHVHRDHPDAVADRLKRDQVGWLPERLKQKIERDLDDGPKAD